MSSKRNRNWPKRDLEEASLWSHCLVCTKCIVPARHAALIAEWPFWTVLQQPITYSTQPQKKGKGVMWQVSYQNDHPLYKGTSRMVALELQIGKDPTCCGIDNYQASEREREREEREREREREIIVNTWEIILFSYHCNRTPWPSRGELINIKILFT